MNNFTLKKEVYLEKQILYQNNVNVMYSLQYITKKNKKYIHIQVIIILILKKYLN
jgi:hypothetical protein